MENNFLDNLLDFYKKHTKRVQFILAVVVGVPLLIFVYTYFYQAPREEKASSSIYAIQYEFGKSDTTKAHYDIILNGETGKSRGAIFLAENFAGTKAGELAKFYAGFSFYRLGNYDRAIAFLEDCSISDKLTDARAISTLADCYAEKGSIEKAAELYIKAADRVGKNLLYAPVYFLRAGLLLTQAQQYSKAEEIYEKALSTFPYEASADIANSTMPNVFDEIERNLAIVRAN